MRFMLLQYYARIEGVEPMSKWEPDEIKAHIADQIQVNAELTERGELVDAQGLTGPELARFVTSDGASAPVVTDGPFAEFKELLAGYRTVDVDSPERAVEIAALVSAAPGPGGRAAQAADRGPRGDGGAGLGRVSRGGRSRQQHRGPAARARAAGPRCRRAAVRQLRRRRRRGPGGPARREPAVARGRPSRVPDGLANPGRITPHDRSAPQRGLQAPARGPRGCAGTTPRLPGGPGPSAGARRRRHACADVHVLPSGAHAGVGDRAHAARDRRPDARARSPAAFMVPEATMAQRISRAKQSIKASEVPFALPAGSEWVGRLRSVLRVLYLIFNEGYLPSSRRRACSRRPIGRGDPACADRPPGSSRRSRGQRVCSR